MENSIGIRVRLDSDGLKKLPQEVEQAAVRLQRVFADLGGSGAAKGQSLFTKLTKGGMSKSDVSEYTRSLQQMNLSLKQYYAEQARIIKSNTRHDAAGLRDQYKTKIDKAPWYKDDLEKEERAARANVNRRGRLAIDALRDERNRTSMDMSSMRFAGQAPPGAGGGAGGGKGGGKGKLGGMLGGSLGRFLPYAAGYVGAHQLHQTADREGNVLDYARGSAGADVQTDREAFVKFKKSLDIDLMDKDQSIALNRQFNGIAGTRGPSEDREMTRTSALYAKGMGVSPEEGVQTFATMAKLGVTTGSHDQEKFAQQLGETIVRSGMRGRQGEAFKSITDFVSVASRTIVGGPKNVDEFLKMQSNLYRGSNGAPGVTGERGTNLLSQTHQALTSDLFPEITAMGPGIMRDIKLMTMLKSGPRDPMKMQKLNQEGLLGRYPDGEMAGEKYIREMEKMGLTHGLGGVLGASMFGHSENIEGFKAMIEGDQKRRQGGLKPIFSMMPKDVQRQIMDNPNRTGVLDALTEKFDKGEITKEQLIEQARSGLAKSSTPESHGRAQTDIDKAVDALLTPMVSGFVVFEQGIVKAAEGLVGLGDTAVDVMRKLGMSHTGADIGTGALQVGAAGAMWYGAKRLLSGGTKAALTGEAATAAAAAARVSVGIGLGAIGVVGAGLAVGGDSDRGLQEFRRKQAQDKLGITGKVASAVGAASAKYGVDQKLIQSIIAEESGGDPNAIGKEVEVNVRGKKVKTRARGAMQIIPQFHWEGKDPEKLMDADTNVDVGTGYLKYLLKRYNGDYSKAVAAYHAGEGNVDNGKIGPQTSAYRKKVMARYNAAGGSSNVAAAYKPATAESSMYASPEEFIRQAYEKAGLTQPQSNNTGDVNVKVTFDPATFILKDGSGKVIETQKIQAHTEDDLPTRSNIEVN